MWKITKNDEVLLEYGERFKFSDYVSGKLSKEFSNWLASQGELYSMTSVLKPIPLPTTNKTDLYLLARHFLHSRRLLKGSKTEGDTGVQDNAGNLRSDVIY